MASPWRDLWLWSATISTRPCRCSPGKRDADQQKPRQCDNPGGGAERPRRLPARDDRAIINEIQRAPELLLALMESVNSHPRPGRFLLTASANLMTLPRVADSLAGRMEVVRLLPLAVSDWWA